MSDVVEVQDTNVSNGDYPTGAFAQSLYRNNRKIRQDRADQIIESAQIHYKRECEDIALNIKQLQREQDNMLDLSPTDARSLVLASDFNAKEYTEKDIAIGVKIRNLQIKLDIAQKRYESLFGETLNL
ncbi:hypothetical protein KC573_04330 [candidate division WWE3 bacterium]|uniref:Uncharacterized protein n=1 Tax=candidate division WWE3 bacterium TaxID=2053526 RepID=A0A955LXI7_UNCKA|nr:hypothetical protein [candidate division WWE3 bacterium]